MSDENGPSVDLLGDPWTEARDPRGRKRHKRTREIAKIVAFSRAAGATEDEVAARVLLDPKTLRKYYSRELQQGPAMARQALIEAALPKALEGNISAIKYVDGLISRGEAQVAKEAIERRGAPAAKPEKLGKKQERLEAAETVAAEGGNYAPLAAPRLVN